MPAKSQSPIPEGLRRHLQSLQQTVELKPRPEEETPEREPVSVEDWLAGGGLSARVELLNEKLESAESRLRALQEANDVAELRLQSLETANQLNQARFLVAEGAYQRSLAQLLAALPAASQPAAERGSIADLPKSMRERLHLRKRLWWLLDPRIGDLRQYPPRPLVLPASYFSHEPLEAAPRISVVTPSYNQAIFLERTMRSILDQEYPELEYIVQDGASTDGSVDLLGRYSARLAHVESAPDSGYVQALNRGFARTSGEIMAYLNSDDILLPGALWYVGRYFSEHPEVDVVYGHRVVIDETDAEIGRWVMPSHSNAVLSWADYVPQETLFWRRRVWERVGGCMDESFKFAGDWDLLVRFREVGATFQRLPRFIGAFRVHSQQKTTTQLGDIGADEMDRIRTRCLGRPVSHEEVLRAIQPYFRQHIVHHLLHRGATGREMRLLARLVAGPRQTSRWAV